ncbi:hypothetical protein [Nonomuraea wenchangensis]|uniref:Uncharacterized protein n=1 Tax=Nonomuraea wenchangensis TaxID=568860 RepID=A0A1I0EEI8_9ACTN|nr:hypothetical protein [Nonomuraea wenchangensis]SET43644.1 hypothetical protein SAMN05421811_10319 [Nonomuraea wenchangensis]
MTEFLAIAGGLVTIATAVAVVIQIMKFLKKVSNFIDDWQGEPERPGVPGRDGVMTRLEKIEAELKTNHGSSLRDAINRIEANLDDLSSRFDEHVKQSDSGRIPGLIDESN